MCEEATMGPTNITTIPNEVLTLIFEYFTDDRETLGNLKRTQPELISAANTVLHSVQEVVVRGVNAAESCDKLLDKLARLKRLQEKPQEGASNFSPTSDGPIRYLDLLFDCAGTRKMKLEQGRKARMVKTRLATRLGELLQEVSFPALVQITVRVVGRPIPYALRNRQAERDDDPYGMAIRDYENLMSIISERLFKKKPTNTHLVLDGCEGVCERTFLKGRPNVVIKSIEATFSTVCDSSIGSLLDELASAKHTLTDVAILEQQGIGWLGSQRQPADFSGFTNLLKLRVAAGVWFEHGARGCGIRSEVNSTFLWKIDNSRPSIAALLPNTLQHLQVDFIGHSGVSAVRTGYWSMFRRMQTDETKLKMRPAYNWMLELPTQLDHVVSVSIPEHAVGDHRAKDCKYLKDGVVLDEVVMKWEPPSDLSAAYEHANVKLGIQIRLDHFR
jgi:hypothetical protein